MQKKISHSLKLISGAVDEFGDKLGVACSFGKDSIVLVHLAQRINPNIKVFSIMTPWKFQLTRQYKDYMAQTFRMNLATFEAPHHFEHTPDLGVEDCCEYYKVEQTKKAIKELGLTAWIAGLRNTEGHTREFLDEIEERDGIIKINPILSWTEAEVWLYHAIYQIPPHPLYLQGYRSLGCEPCSKPNTETERGGRWEGTDKCGGECGIHSKSLA